MPSSKTSLKKLTFPDGQVIYAPLEVSIQLGKTSPQVEVLEVSREEYQEKLPPLDKLSGGS